MEGGGGGVNQAYSLLSTTHGHITDCKLDSVVYAGVGIQKSELTLVLLDAVNTQYLNFMDRASL